MSPSQRAALMVTEVLQPPTDGVSCQLARAASAAPDQEQRSSSPMPHAGQRL